MHRRAKVLRRPLLFGK